MRASRQISKGDPDGQVDDDRPDPLRDLWPWALVAAFLIVVLYLVTLDQGAVSRAGLFLHELMHDGRHVLALPCH